MGENEKATLVFRVREARERIRESLRGQAEQLRKFDESLKGLLAGHEQLESETSHQFKELETIEFPAPPVSLEAVLAAVRNLITATLPEQVFGTLAEEASQMGVRAVVFDVRGKAAWGASAHGFGPRLTEQALRSMVVSLNINTPFRQVYETGGHFEGNSDALKKNRNVLDRLDPNSGDSILLLPIRSAGAVAAIFYSDSAGKGALIPRDALQILAEFAGAQLDRLMALSGGLPAAAAEDTESTPQSAPAAPETVEATEELTEESTVEASHESEVLPPQAEATALITEEVLSPPPASPAESPAAEPPAESPSVPATRAAGFDVSQLSEADQKTHKDARRFAKLLVSEIELYNKAKVAEGRRNKDLYTRLRLDIDRSRQTFEKRFGKTVGKQFDYFHDELVRTLTANDPSLLGSEYPGPSV